MTSSPFASQHRSPAPRRVRHSVWLRLSALVLVFSASTTGTAAAAPVAGAASSSSVLAHLSPSSRDAVGEHASDGAAVRATWRADADVSPEGRWLWPFLGTRRVAAPFRAPAHLYGPGHRGMDLVGTGEVRSAADGIVAFRGVVVDRPVITVAHGDGLVATYEPVESTLEPGAPVRRGESLGRRTTGGHAPSGALHLGVRRDGVYVDPLPFFAPIPRAVLHPCGSSVC